MKPSPLSRLLLAVVPFASLAQAQDPQQPPARPEPKPIVDTIDLKDGDTLVFLGDSITHQCLYTQYVEDYYYTRYPKARIHFHNSGVGGDRASDALTRFDEDVAEYKPKYVTILLGMNDGAYTDFQKPVFDTYTRDMMTVLDRIATIGATAVPMTPTMHDSRARRLYGQPAEPRDTYYNGVLALYGAWLREQADVRGLGFVDMYSPLNSITLEQRTKDPKWTMIRDAVHPGQSGQVIMASAILNDMVPPSSVSSIVIGEKDGGLKGDAKGGSLTELAGADGRISFTFAAESLPWALPPDAADGYRLASAGDRFSKETVAVHSLKPGKYDVKIDGQIIGTWDEEELEAGIRLETNAKTPQYQQALQVALLNQKRNDQAYRPIRDLYGKLKGQRRDVRKATEANAPDLDAKKAAFDQWYTDMKSQVSQLKAKAKDFEDQIYNTNQPKPHRYEIAPAS